ncbi:MAG: PAS domain S-box-containing protein [Natronomonas sp.]|jgi:PAS domain S-box-containing protein
MMRFGSVAKAGTGDEMSEPTSSETDIAVLLVSDDQPIVESVGSYLTDRAGFAVSTAGNVEAVRTRLDDESIDCLVVETDTVQGASARFITSVRDTAPNCPIVLLTGSPPSTLDDELLGPATTVVEKDAEHTEWEFLAEKIRGAVRQRASIRNEFEMYERLVESARDGLYRLNANARVVYLNESFAGMLGYDRAELIGTHASKVMLEGELEKGQAVVREVLGSDDTESDLIEMRMETKDGDRIVVAVHFVVLTTDDGSYDGLMGIVRDVTEQKKRQRELERQNERLEEFAGIVSHDLKAPLSVAKGRLDLAFNDCDSEHLEAVRSSHERMESLIDQTLTLARKGQTVGRTKAVGLDSAVEQARKTVPTGGLELHVDGSYVVDADPDRLRTLLENLLRNAIEHGSTGSPSQIQGDAVEHDDENVTVRIGPLDDDEGFFVEDDGPGIPPEQREDVLEAGYTTGTGSGFGLAIIRQISHAHGWDVEVTESDDGGARFEFTTE